MRGLLFILALVFLTMPAQAQCTPPSDGLVGHWTMDGDGTDSSGNGNNGAVVGANVTWEAGGMLDGNVQIGNSSGLQVTQTASINDLDRITVAAWVKGIYDGGATLVHKWPGFQVFGNITEQWIQFEAPRWGTSVGRWRTPNNTFDGGTTWKHFVVTYDYSSTTNNARLYINGQRVSATEVGTPAGTLNSESADLYIGNHSGMTNDWNNDIDDLRIYNRVLSAAEIAALYAVRSTADAPAGAMFYDHKHARLAYCNGTDWVHAGIGSYNPNAVEFDGTNDWLTAPSLTLADTNKVTGNLWLRFAAAPTTTEFILSRATGPRGLAISYPGGGSERVEPIARDSSGTVVGQIRCGGAPFAAGQWHHVLFSFDLSDDAKYHCYVNDTAAASVASAFNNAAVMDLATSAVDWNIGAYQNTDPAFNGDLADLWIDFGTYLDLSVEANRRKFISPSGMPMYLGPDGSIPTGSAPDIFLSGSTDDWQTNKGTGGGFTENGELSTASSQPMDSGGSSGIVVGWGSSDSNWLAYVVAAFERSTCTPSINNLVSDSMGASGSSFTLPNYTVPAVTDGMLIVAIANEDDNNASQGVPASVTFDGSPLTEAITVTSSNDKTASLYFLGNPAQTTGDIVVTASGTVEAIQVGAYVADCLKNQAPAVTGSNAGSVAGTGIATTLSNVPPGALVVDSFEHGGSAAASMSVSGEGQIILFTQDTNSGVTSSQGASYRLAGAPAGALRYNDNFKVMQYFNGVEWVAMGPIGGTPPTDGLVGHWKLDEDSGTTAIDSSPYGNDGTYQNYDPATDSVSGKLDRAANFNNNPADPEAHMYAPLLNDLENARQVTLSLWIKLASGAGALGARGIMEKGDYIIFRKHTGALSTLFYAPAWQTTGGGWWGPALSENVWQHIVVTYDYNDLGAKPQYHLNGQPLSASEITAPAGSYVAPSAGSLLFSRRHNSSNSAFPGLMDDIRLYNRILTPTEIQQLYHHGLSNGLGEISADCEIPSLPEGSMFYNIDHNVMQYCNGENWVGIGWSPP